MAINLGMLNYTDMKVGFSGRQVYADLVMEIPCNAPDVCQKQIDDLKAKVDETKGGDFGPVCNYNMQCIMNMSMLVRSMELVQTEVVNNIARAVVRIYPHQTNQGRLFLLFSYLFYRCVRKHSNVDLCTDRMSDPSIVSTLSNCSDEACIEQVVSNL